MKITCEVCLHPVEQEEISQYASFGGLPSPCCNICFEVNDYTCKSINDVAVKSLYKRASITLNNEVE